MVMYGRGEDAEGFLEAYKLDVKGCSRNSLLRVYRSGSDLLKVTNVALQSLELERPLC